MSQPKVLVVDDESNIRLVLCEVLKREGLAPDQCANGADALEKVRAEAFDIVIMDVRMPRMDGITALREMMRVRPETAVLIITAHGSEKTALEAIEAGAYDYFSKPFDINEVRVVVRRAAERIRLLKSLKAAREESVSRYSFDRIVGQSSGMRDVFDDRAGQVGLYRGTPLDRSTIVDFVAWGDDPGPAAQNAVDAGFWRSGQFVVETDPSPGGLFLMPQGRRTAAKHSATPAKARSDLPENRL